MSRLQDIFDAYFRPGCAVPRYIRHFMIYKYTRLSTDLEAFCSAMSMNNVGHCHCVCRRASVCCFKVKCRASDWLKCPIEPYFTHNNIHYRRFERWCAERFITERAAATAVLCRVMFIYAKRHSSPRNDAQSVSPLAS